MSENLPENANIRQLRVQAKELLRTLPSGSKLADAQLLIARKYGFDSWPKLVAQIETPGLLEQFRAACRALYVPLISPARERPISAKRIGFWRIWTWI
jgi:hypothetical protein